MVSTEPAGEESDVEGAAYGGHQASELHQQNLDQEESVAQQQAVGEMSATQRAQEQASMEVSNVLTNLDHALARAKKALTAVQKTGIDANAEIALKDLIAELQASRKRFVHATYYAVETRMF